MVKPCIKCGAKDRNKRGECNLCKKITAAAWYKSNPEKAKLAATKWQKSNPEKAKLIKTNWNKVNPEKIKLAKANWKKSNSEKAKLTIANWYKTNTNYAANWRKANPDALRIYSHNRQARLRANGGKLSPDLAETLYKRQKGKCVCCKEPLGKGYHLDHIMPIKLGGKNEDWNIQLLKASCNLQKKAKHPIEYMQSKGLLL